MFSVPSLFLRSWPWDHDVKFSSTAQTCFKYLLLDDTKHRELVTHQPRVWAATLVAEINEIEPKSIRN